MLGMMQGQRLKVSGTLAYTVETICNSGVRSEKTDINALASATKDSVAVLLWNYHDKDLQDDGAQVILTLKNISAQSAVLYHYRIDKSHSNSYEVWKKMGSPQNPTTEQIQELEQSGQLEMMSEPAKIKIENHQYRIEMQLPRQAVSLVKLVFRSRP